MSKWGIDLGGTKIEGIVIDDDNPLKVLSRQRISTEADKGYSHVLKRIFELVKRLEKSTNSKSQSIGIGTPGSIFPPTGLLKNCNTLHLNGKPIKNDLERILGIPVLIANDANCFTLAETKIGIVADKLPQANIVFGIILGTGVGGGLVINGKAWNGSNGIAGEWGHNYLHQSGGKCYCGKTGCTETIISGPALENHYFELANEKLALNEIFVQVGFNEHAAKTIERLLHYFGIAVSGVINMIDPDAIIVGGGVGNIDLLYTKGVEKIVSNVFNPDCNTKIFKPKLGDSAGVFGAALLNA